MKTCCNCDSPMEAEELFCSGCGTEQRSDIRGQKSEDRGKGTEIRDQKSDDSGQGSPNIEHPATESSSTTNHQPSTIPPQSDSIDSADSGIFPPPVGRSECADLDVRFNAARILMEDASYPIEFQITPRCEGIKKLKIFIAGQHGLKFEGRCRSKLKLGVERGITLDVQIPKGLRGMLSFEVTVEYQLDHKVHRFGAVRSTEVYARDLNSIQSLAINIQQEAREAGDNGSINMDGVEKLAERGDWSAVLKELAKRPPQWAELLLEEYDGDDGGCGSMSCMGLVGEAPLQARLSRMTIEASGKKIHLISGDRVQLGRNRDSDIVTRIFDEAGSMPREENLYISKFHCGFVKEGAAVKIQDGSVKARDPKEKTWLNGKLVKGAALLSSSNETISFGKPGTPGRLFSVTAKVLLSRSDDGMSEAAGVLLKRTDHVPESYLIVYDRVALKNLGAEWDGWCVARHKAGFCFGKEIACRWLIPGTREFVGAQLVDVTEFSQYGL